MKSNLYNLSSAARQAAEYQDWATVDAYSQKMLKLDPNSAEGNFLAGLVLKASQRPVLAGKFFEKALSTDFTRYDAAVELANQYSIQRRNAEAAKLLKTYEARLDKSPMYLDMAGTIYCDIGLPTEAWPLFRKANEIQPDIGMFQANLAACAVYLGKIEDAKVIYEKLLEQFPEHRRYHYHLSRLNKAKCRTHIDQMKNILSQTTEPPSRNIYLYYAIAKELEDIEAWEESFKYYEMGGEAVTSVSSYEIGSDLHLIETIINECNEAWFNDQSNITQTPLKKTPIFIVGLPRTGTTLVERIISSHSNVDSLGETQFLQMILRSNSGIKTVENMNSEIISALTKKKLGKIGESYFNAISYRLSNAPMFIDKLPYNFLFLGFIIKAFPDVKIIHLRRKPMDACFSMYKQLFTWAYRFSYSLESLGKYYIAHDRLAHHWKRILGDSIIEVQYEDLVTNPKDQIRDLLKKLGLSFEPACLDFQENSTASTTASAVQVREKVYTGSVNRSMQFEKELNTLKEYLESYGVKT